MPTPCLRFGSVLFFALITAAAGSARTVLNAADFGAVGDGRTNDTAAFARVMSACAAEGGGTVWVPAGKFLTGSVRLFDNCELHLEPGAELLYSGNPDDSPIVSSRWEGTSVYASAPLIYANGCRNISITGRGTLNGQGWNWWWRVGRGQPPPGSNPKAARSAWLATYKRVEAGEKLSPDDFRLASQYLRPSLVGLYHCRNVLIDGVTLFKSPMWMLHPVYSEDIVIHGVHFVSADPAGHPSAEGIGPNGDGVDVDSCRNVRISDCFFNTSDDCIVIKSGRDNDGRRTGVPTEFVTVTNCVMYQGHGAVVIGSETAGGIRDISASNIVCEGTETGVRIKSQRGRGGVLENMRFDNWIIENAKKPALEITMRYSRTPQEPVSARTPAFRNFAFSNITIVNARRVAAIEGLPEKPIEQLRFTDINATGRAGFSTEDAADVAFDNVRVTAQSGSALSFARSHQVVVDALDARTRHAGAAAVAISDSGDFRIRDAQAAAGTRTFLQVSGTGSSDIQLLDDDLTAARQPVVLDPGVPASAVSRR